MDRTTTAEGQSVSAIPERSFYCRRRRGHVMPAECGRCYRLDVHRNKKNAPATRALCRSQNQEVRP